MLPMAVRNIETMTGYQSETYSISPVSNSPLKVLQTVFGHKEFRPGQEEAILNLLSGKDTIVIIPKGGGKGGFPFSSKCRAIDF